MDVGVVMFIIAISGVLVLGSVNLYLVSIIRKLEKENARLQPPF